MIKPIRDMVLVRPDTAPGKIGLIYVPDSGKQSDKTFVLGTVLAVGSKVEHAKVGNQVHLCAYGSHPAGEEIEHEGQKLVLLRERDINGIVQ